MQTHLKKRLEVVIEAPMARSLARLLDEHDRGYTMLPVLGGSGRSGPWTREGQVSSAGGMVAFIVILDEAALPPLLDEIFSMVERHVGTLAISDCQVVRGERF